MKYLLDTCVLSEFSKPVPNAQVSEWILNAEQSDIFISVFAIGEIRKGIDKLAAGKKRQQLNEWFQEIMDWAEHRILSFDKASAKNWGTLLARLETKGRSLPIIDSMIAATAITHDCAIVTRNVSDFIDMDVLVIDPWDKVYSH